MYRNYFSNYMTTMKLKNLVYNRSMAVVRRRFVKIVALFLIAGWAFLFAGSAAQADWKDDIGYTQLAAELGDALPTGQGISITQVEAGVSDTGCFQPDTLQFTDQTFNFRTTTPSGVSSHATTVGSYLYGPSSVAPDAGTDGAAINIWEANDWISLSVGRLATESADVANFSWIGTTGSSSADTRITKQFDYTINRDDYVAVVGVDNGNGSALPNLLCQSYNAISVGLSSGNHSAGYTTIDGAGRMKPDIVAPAAFTSYAAPMVSSAAALLLQTAKSTSGYGNAAHSESIKAILMAGATKTEFSDWSHTQTHPLDSTYGAGELNVYRSYAILAGGEQKAGNSQVVSGKGWDFNQTSSSSSEKLYFFDVPTNMTLDEFSAVLTWNCLVNSSSLTTTLANLDLKLWKASDFTTVSLLDQSISTVDNVELLYLKNLDPGRYAMSVTSDTGSIDYALAWYSGNLILDTPIGVPEPSSLLMLLTCVAIGMVLFGRSKAGRYCR
jgi:hypothetical protein